MGFGGGVLDDARAPTFLRHIFRELALLDCNSTPLSSALYPRPPAVKRTEMQLLDIDENDVTDDGAIASVMNPETGDTVDDLRVPLDDPEYKGLREALAEDKKDIFITILEAMGIRKIQAQFATKGALRERD